MEITGNVRRNVSETNERELHRIVDRQAYVESDRNSGERRETKRERKKSGMERVRGAKSSRSSPDIRRLLHGIYF
jgi:hypothetical protein